MILDQQHKAVWRAANEFGPREAYYRMLAASDADIRRPTLDNGRELAAQRTAIHTGLAAHWVDAQRAAFGYERPFALVALGGTGRGEMSPCSDTDFALLFEEPTKDNPFLQLLLRQSISQETMFEQYGFTIRPQPYNLEHVETLEGMQLNAFLDMRPIYDPYDLARTFRERIRATFDPFMHFLHVSRGWRDAKLACLGSGCERLDRFDIKNEGLRTFLAGVWAIGGAKFCHSVEVYDGLADQRDVQAYYFLLRIRAYIHLRRGTHEDPNVDGSHVEDVLTFDDFESFGEMLGPHATSRERFEFANTVRVRLLSSRRRVERFARGVIGTDLRDGHPTHPGSSIRYGFAGLRYEAAGKYPTRREHSEAALSLLVAAQKYGVGIDPAELDGTFASAGEWLELTPALSALFYETRGSLANSLEFLAQLDGALEKLFPGYTNFESSLDERVLEERVTLRSVWMREKLRALDAVLRASAQQFSTSSHRQPLNEIVQDTLPIEAAQLDSDDLAAVKLALVTKRLPLTADDIAEQENTQRELHERYSSGFSHIALPDYFGRYAQEAGFSTRTIELAEFLVANRRTLKEYSSHGQNTSSLVDAFVTLCGNEQRMRALFVFTCIDRLVGIPEPRTLEEAESARHRQRPNGWWSHENSSERWFNTRELYYKALRRFVPTMESAADETLERAGFGQRDLEVLRDFGQDYFGGLYHRHTNRFASHLVKLVDKPDEGPMVACVRNGESTILGVAARDFRGLAACIAGSLYRQQVAISQAHLFSASRYRLALDFFHLTDESVWPEDLVDVVREDVRLQRHIAESDGASLPALNGNIRIVGAGPRNCQLSLESQADGRGLLYALTYKVFYELGGSIHALRARATRGGAYITVHLTLPRDFSLEQAQRIVAQWR